VLSFSLSPFSHLCVSMVSPLSLSLFFPLYTGFIINKTAMTWRDAQSYCRQHHTDLASISSPEQQNLISKESSLWIGLFLDSWEWSNQWSYFFRYWAADQPLLSLVSSNCAGMSTTDSGKWAQYSCDLKQPFICYGAIVRQIKVC
uniref:C-type lectin domain-containing protein n=1 Tax=Sinocyclocheilus anshuiensis TaxID=1608454 RepID=A0A671L861_9TELE